MTVADLIAALSEYGFRCTPNVDMAARSSTRPSAIVLVLPVVEFAAERAREVDVEAARFA